MNHDTAAYGLWTLVILNSAIFPQIQRADPDITSHMARRAKTYGSQVYN